MAYNPYYGGNPYNGYNNNAYAYNVNPQTYYQVQPQVQQNHQQRLIYVHGIEGANAYQLPPGVTQETLWDDTDDCFYVKGYDETGRPKIIAWNDYKPHVVEQPKSASASNADMSKYATKDDVNALLETMTSSPYVTKDELYKVIGSLRIGEQGRIVSSNEHDA